METVRFFPPEKALPKARVYPVFLPFQGCPDRCVFCAQELQTGCHASPVRALLRGVEENLLELLRAKAAPRELAFYGGTFTRLPWEDQRAALEMAALFRARGLVTRVRASTRPDALSPDALVRLRDAGLDMLELGVQSFDDNALGLARRGYGGACARDGCRMVKEAGLELGIQLLPGMPGVTPDVFASDMRRVVEAAPATLRLYPCLVLAGTELARMWREGAYMPWGVGETAPLLADAVLLAWENGIRVIRIGLAPEEKLDDGGILDGPRHPALGSMVRGQALFRYMARHIAVANGAPCELFLPRRLQGEFWGHGGSLVAAYAACGLPRSAVHWHHEEWCALRWGE